MAMERRGAYRVEDGVRLLYVGDDLYAALAVMRTADVSAKLYRLDEDEEGAQKRVLLAFHRAFTAVVPF